MGSSHAIFLYIAAAKKATRSSIILREFVFINTITHFWRTHSVAKNRGRQLKLIRKIRKYKYYLSHRGDKKSAAAVAVVINSKGSAFSFGYSLLFVTDL